MERESFDVTDYDPEENEWRSISDIVVPHSGQMSGPSSPTYQIPTMNDSEEHVITMVNVQEDKVDPLSNSRVELKERRKRIASVSEQLKRLKPLSTAKNPRRNRPKSTLKGLKMFIEKVEDGWITVERRFDNTTADSDGMLIRSKFGECVGISSKEFAVEVFDTLARRGYMRGHVIDKDQLREWWDVINDQSFDSWLMLFFDMADKDADGRLTQDEVREFISLIASANSLSTINEKADEYAALTMEEFDPHGLGYISLDGFEMLLMQLETECVIRTSAAEETNKPMISQNPLKSWFRTIEELSSSSLIPCLKKRTPTKKKP